MRALSRTWVIFASLAWVALSLGCGASESRDDRSQAAARQATPAGARPPAAASSDAAAEAEQIFTTRCVTCHGPEGRGDGPGSVALTPRPRNFQDPAWQDEVSDEHIANIVMYGGAAVGRSPTMPGNPDLSGRPEAVRALVAYVRGLRSN